MKLAGSNMIGAPRMPPPGPPPPNIPPRPAFLGSIVSHCSGVKVRWMVQTLAVLKRSEAFLGAFSLPVSAANAQRGRARIRVMSLRYVRIGELVARRRWFLPHRVILWFSMGEKET